MLCELRVKNFAIVEDGAIVLSKGMSAFTGETGAGKSLLLNAITLLLGAKARADLVRSGAQSAEVEGVFDLSRDAEKRALAAELGFEVDLDEGAMLLVRREISASEPSKNRVWVQGRSATRSQLQELLGNWVEVSGQHEFLRLGREDYVLNIVDDFGCLKAELLDYQERYKQWKKIQTELEDTLEAEKNRAARLDYLRFQVEELERAGIHPGLKEEEEQLTALRTRLGSLEKIRLALANTQVFIEGAESSDGGGSQQSGARALLDHSLKELRPFESMGQEFSSILKKLDEASQLSSEISSELNKIERGLELDPEKLESAETKLTLIKRLKRKYNVESDELSSLYENAKSELQKLERSEDRQKQLQDEVKRVFDVALGLAQRLHKRRVESAKALETQWQKDVRMLGMPNARFKIALQDSAELSLSGVSTTQALFSANAGEDLKSLGKVASGGELSRIMLALKNVVSGRSEVSVYLFDEVDAGIGGETAHRVGERLRSIAKNNQVLVVTHLAQVAAFAHEQFRIEKKTQAGRTRTSIEVLDAKERSGEIARMLGGSQSQAAKVLAKELLKQATEGRT